MHTLEGHFEDHMKLYMQLYRLESPEEAFNILALRAVDRKERENA